MRWWQQLSLRFKLALGINLAMLIILGGAFYGTFRYIQAQLWEREVEAAESLNAVAAVLLEDAMMVGRKDKVQEALVKLGQRGGVGLIVSRSTTTRPCSLPSPAAFPEGGPSNNKAWGRM